MKKQLILHIPHTETIIPDKTGYLINDAGLRHEQLVLTDWYTDELYASTKDISVIAPFSRIFCDVERFADDELEEKARIGMGALYTKTVDGKHMRHVDAEFRQRVLDLYYTPHHNRLFSAVKSQLDAHDQALIVDCHSFPDHPFTQQLLKGTSMTDFSIGTDAFHTPQQLVDYSLNFLRERGYSVNTNDPFSGSMVPLPHYQKDKRVMSIMLEINRELYLEKDTNVKSERFDETRKVTSEYLDGLREILERM